VFETTLLGVPLRFETAEALFSPDRVDAGTQTMLRHVTFSPEDKVLDLGCGYGAVGIYAAKRIGAARVTMTDIDPLAVQLAKANAGLNGVPNVRVLQSDAFNGIDDTGYTLILCNPPYHEDFGVARRFIEKGFNRLALGGRMVLVVKRRLWYENKLRAIFGGAPVEKTGGYFVMTAEKRLESYAKAKPRHHSY